MSSFVDWESPQEFWQLQLDYCKRELESETSEPVRKHLQDEIDIAIETLKQIEDGTYQPSEMCHEVWTIELQKSDDRTQPTCRCNACDRLALCGLKPFKSNNRN